MSEYMKGDRVAYQSIAGGTVRAVVTATGQDEMGAYVEMRVTSRRNPVYPRGHVERVSATTPFLSRIPRA